MNLHLQERKPRFTLRCLPPLVGGGSARASPPPSSSLPPRGHWAMVGSPREGAVERLTKSLVTCQSVVGLVITGLAGRWGWEWLQRVGPLPNSRAGCPWRSSGLTSTALSSQKGEQRVERGSSCPRGTQQVCGRLHLEARPAGFEQCAVLSPLCRGTQDPERRGQSPKPPSWCASLLTTLIVNVEAGTVSIPVYRRGKGPSFLPLFLPSFLPSLLSSKMY